MILAIDPGNEKSAYALLGIDLKPAEFGILENEELLIRIPALSHKAEHFAIEMVASYGMAVGKTVFDTVFWIGRFWETAADNFMADKMKMVYRMEEKMALCHNSRAKDGNIRQALIDRFGVVGVKASPGWFYGVSKDVWAAIAVGVTYADLYLAKGA